MDLCSVSHSQTTVFYSTLVFAVICQQTEMHFIHDISENNLSFESLPGTVNAPSGIDSQDSGLLIRNVYLKTTIRNQR